ncbi:DNA helicase-2/ATP-dependent DNA helicase PcrA [Anaeroplasma bactoclasticum]|jgi:DNA helicase-2/ATP-dependent DNA helicase PcrA|uniref:DNA 3'-5' helicase n=1 Tax=Anaeroplasma bactoclasticum TaxID=2088 RepID=A0A397RWW6_9MOLU|nr:UvrD-helicase domain-containing protein [Anaeroplasma bactoclasticum]RIA78238.1 DNA helicase-2/ATP-dependent DNA helicase PcrA [Anaeroplasma bactoclasticum]
MDLLANLNPAQRLAVTSTEGPVMVMAGAGSGKTKVLTTRISYIIKELGIIPSKILAVTFTNKAAKEMKDRISSMLDINTSFMWVSTFHSFCARVLRMEIEAMPPYTKRFVIIDEEDSLKLVKDILKECELEYKPKEIKHLISKNKNFKNFSIKDPRLLDVFLLVNKKYEDRCKEENLLDFDDLIIKTIELFEKNPKILEYYQNQFEYILVDEFQDTNALQYDLMAMLAKKHKNLFVVGDDFQSIYSFRGAKIENINKFQEDYKDYKLILLEENYRSTTQILNLANNIIIKNPNQIKKVMFSNKKEGPLPKYYRAMSSYDETVFVINKILEGIRKGKDYKDFAIMYRANSISRSFEDQLVKNKIPYTIYGGLSFFARAEIKDMTAYLRLLVHKDDDYSFKRVINMPKRKIGAKILDSLNMIASEKGLPLYDAIEYYTGSGIGASNLKEFKKVLDDIREKMEDLPLPLILKELVDKTGYEEEIKKDEDTYLDRMDNIKEFSSVLKETEEEYEGITHFEMLENLLFDLSLRSEHDDSKSDESVRLTTFHQAKGLEFDTVFMVAMEESIFPGLNVESNQDMEEERRICYVGITRAKNELYLTNAENRMRFGTTEYMVPSRFIGEMDKELYQNVSRGAKTKSPVNQGYSIAKAKFTVKKEEPKEAPSVSYSIGDKINHKAFGDGLVVAVSGTTITVAFKAPFGVKQLNGNHPSIRKI